MKKTNDTVFRKLNRYRLRFADKIVIILYIFLLIVKCDCETKFDDSSQYVNETKIVNNIENNLESNNCHSCENSNLNQDYITKGKVNNEEKKSETFMEEVIDTINTFTKKYIIVNQTESQLENEFEKVLDNALSKDRYEILEGFEIKLEDTKKDLMRSDKAEGRALFSTYTYEYRIYQKIKNFFETHILSINLPKAARLMGFRCKYICPLSIQLQMSYPSLIYGGGDVKIGYLVFLCVFSFT